MVKCCTTETLILPEGHQVSQWGVLAPLLLILFLFQGIQIRPLRLSSLSWTPVPDAPEVIVQGMHGTKYKHGSLISHQFSHKSLLTHMWIYVNWDAGTHT